MALSLLPMGVWMFGGASRLMTSCCDKALGRVWLLRGRSMARKGLCSARFSRTRKLKNDFSAEMRLELLRLEIF